jgi:hypothetical protein
MLEMLLEVLLSGSDAVRTIISHKGHRSRRVDTVALCD